MIRNFFSTNGTLSQVIPHFKPRDVQTKMAMAVEEAIVNNAQLVIEAGTGIGKTYAYLVPILVSGKKAIVSTGSKNLQEQLYHRDLPLMAKVLGFSGRTALLKGRSNYLCLERLSRQLVESHYDGGDALVQLVKIRSWSCETKTGDLAECESLTEDSQLISNITSTNENCLGKNCPNFSECFVAKARKKAMEADVVVVNHHLFFADLAIKETGFAELIPEAEVFIFDEAHQLPDVASQYFGQSITSRQIQELAKDINIAYRTELKDFKQLEKVAIRLAQAVMDLCIVLGEPENRGNWRDMMYSKAITSEITRLKDAFELCIDVLKTALNRSQLLDAAFEHTSLLKTRFERICDVSVFGFSYWYECERNFFSLNISPLSVAEKFFKYVGEHKGAWVFTSATLAVNSSFSYFCSRLGLKPTQEIMLASPFDFESQALLCVPRFLPEPNSEGIAKKLALILAGVIEKNQGRCFFLCTSHHMVRELAKEFRSLIDLPVLVQGETSKQKLLQEYLALGNALLIATGAFWEGIDVKGQALSCVIVDKLPFSAPNDPLLRARIEDCRLQGGDPFVMIQLPDAVISLKQGLGRLIRDTKDKGALIVCDHRLVSQAYGAVFLQSLPQIPRTRDISKVSEFLVSL